MSGQNDIKWLSLMAGYLEVLSLLSPPNSLIVGGWVGVVHSSHFIGFPSTVRKKENPYTVSVLAVKASNLESVGDTMDPDDS